MKNRYFTINKDSTCSLRCDDLNPMEMLELSERLKHNANFIITGCKLDPIEVMKKTCRRSVGQLSFQLSYSAPVLTVDLAWPTCPAPNVALNDAQAIQYANLFNQMVE